MEENITMAHQGVSVNIFSSLNTSLANEHKYSLPKGTFRTSKAVLVDSFITHMREGHMLPGLQRHSQKLSDLCT